MPTPTPAPINYPETNLIDTTAMTNAQVREVEFVAMFSESVKKLVEALGVTRKVPKQAGTVIKVVKAAGTLSNTPVPEGAVIPLSQYAVQSEAVGEMTLNKWRKATSAEAIVEYGYDQAVTMTTDRMLKDVQKRIRANFFGFLANTVGVGFESANNLQDALAHAWGDLQVKFEDDDVNTVFFMNPGDVADYLATAQISVQNAFGMSYVKDFLGLGTLILNASVEKGKVYATAADNIVLYYIPVNGADLGEAFAFTSDETGYVGIHEVPDYVTMTASDVVISGLTLFAERADGIVGYEIGTGK